MKRVFLVLVCILAMWACTSETKTSDGSQDNAFKIERGTNIAHWLSQSDRRGVEREAFFTEKDVRFIDSVGFDHIRLPIDEVQMWDENGSRHEDAFKLLADFLGWCSEAGLRVVLDLHILSSHHFNEGDKPLWTDPAEQVKFIRILKV